MGVTVPAHSGFLLKDVIEKLGISQRKLAKLLNSTQDWVGRLHNGKTSPSWGTVLRIARALEVSVGVFADNDPARLEFFQRCHDSASRSVEPPAAMPATKSKRRKKVSA